MTNFTLVSIMFLNEFNFRRKSNAFPEDKYPAMTICIAERITDRRGMRTRTKPIFVEKRLQINGLSVFNYWNIITGKMNKIGKLPDFSNVTIDLDELMISIDSNYLLKNLSLVGDNFYLSHQDAGQICYSMQSEFKQDQLNFMEDIILETRKVSNGILSAYIHFMG